MACCRSERIHGFLEGDTVDMIIQGSFLATYDIALLKGLKYISIYYTSGPCAEARDAKDKKILHLHLLNGELRSELGRVAGELDKWEEWFHYDFCRFSLGFGDAENGAAERVLADLGEWEPFTMTSVAASRGASAFETTRGTNAAVVIQRCFRRLVARRKADELLRMTEGDRESKVAEQWQQLKKLRVNIKAGRSTIVRKVDDDRWQYVEVVDAMLGKEIAKRGHCLWTHICEKHFGSTRDPLAKSDEFLRLMWALHCFWKAGC